MALTRGQAPTDSQLRQMRECVDAGRREQLARYVAPPALLFVGGPAADTPKSFNLSRANVWRIVAVTGAVLLATILLTVVLALRLVRPLRALTAAASSTGGEPALVPVRRRDEIGMLAEAFNDLTRRRRRAEEQRKEMVADVAHELRTPLANIRSWLEAVEDGLADDPALAAALLQEAQQLQHIVDDLQDLAAADAGRLTLNLAPVRLSDLVDSVVTAHAGAAEAAGVTLRSRAPAVTLDADPIRLRQAIGNLVSNAVRHTPPGGSVTILASAGAISVTDTGEGISPADLPHVFNRFWRADRSRSRRTGGSGLGLAIVRQIAEAHHGTATATSTPGEGSTFTIHLPAAAPPEQLPTG